MSPQEQSEIELLLTETDAGAAEAQRIGWSYEAWKEKLAGLPAPLGVEATLDALEDCWARDDGLSRAAVAEVGGEDPVALLIASMAWGFGPIPYGSTRTRRMLDRGPGELRRVLGDIQTAARQGAAAGFSSLFEHRRTRVTGLSIAMGSKFLYFSARGAGLASPKPLVYDQNVYWALSNLTGGPDDVPDPGKYMTGVRYAQVIEWMEAMGKTYGLAPDDVEVALFGAARWRRRNRRLGVIPTPTGEAT